MMNLPSVDVSLNGCWLWHGATSDTGYGNTWVRGRVRLVHRVSYETFNGPILPGYIVHHTCEVRACWNPEHLTAVSRAEHACLHAPETCPKGHNEWRIKRGSHGGRRDCAVCHRERERRRRYAASRC